MNSIQSRNLFSKLSGKLIKMGCAVLLSILVVSCGIQATTTSPAVTATVAAPTAALDEKVVLRESINQALGTDNRNVPRLTKISYSVPEAGDITIIWAIHDKVSQNATKVGAQMDATNILKVLEHNKTRFIYVILIGTFTTQDQHGNTAETQVMSLGFNKSKLEKINWDDFQPSTIYDLADVADIADEWK